MSNVCCELKAESSRTSRKGSDWGLERQNAPNVWSSSSTSQHLPCGLEEPVDCFPPFAFGSMSEEETDFNSRKESLLKRSKVVLGSRVTANPPSFTMHWKRKPSELFVLIFTDSSSDHTSFWVQKQRPDWGNETHSPQLTQLTSNYKLAVRTTSCLNGPSFLCLINHCPSILPITLLLIDSMVDPLCVSLSLVADSYLIGPLYRLSAKMISSCDFPNVTGRNETRG